jgi:hypothetical protein
MRIIVDGREIETKDIVDIIESGDGKHGFTIQLRENKEERFEINKKYDSTYMYCREINDRYRRLRDQIYEKWQEDKIDIPVFKL